MCIPLCEGDFDAIIFDCDGTLIDAAPAHFKAYNALLPLRASRSIGAGTIHGPGSRLHAWLRITRQNLTE